MKITITFTEKELEAIHKAVYAEYEDRDSSEYDLKAMKSGLDKLTESLEDAYDNQSQPYKWCAE